MAFDLIGLGAMLGSVPGGYLDAQRARQNLAIGALQRQAAIEKLQDMASVRRAQAAAASGLFDDGGGLTLPGTTPMPAPPQPMAPGQPSVPAARPAAPPVAAGGPSPSPVPQSPARPPAPLAASPGGFPGLNLASLAQRIKAANPGIDNRTLFLALQQGASMLNPLGKQQLSFLMGMLRLQQGQARLDTERRGQDLAHQDRQQNAAALQAYRGQMTRIAQARLNLAAKGGQPLSDDDTTFLAEALQAGDPQLLTYVMGFSRNRPAIFHQIMTKFHQLYPGEGGADVAGNVAAYGGTKRAASAVGATAGNVAVGAAELPRISAKIADISKKVDLTRFPTINAIRQAVVKRAGSPEQQRALQQFLSYVQTARNAYQQIAARGGRMSDKVREQGEELISGTMSPGALQGALDAFATEANIVKGATGEAMRDITGGAGTQPPAAAAPRVGTVEDGYRFKGGDPANQANWEKVQ